MKKIIDLILAIFALCCFISCIVMIVVCHTNKIYDNVISFTISGIISILQFHTLVDLYKIDKMMEE